eukprot:CAMPEP_0179474328 /NCGR_PEP_ID=MMETSP0799-20121207/53812_1 /TAXON_ID=46947 /ORGANISM="Geminigera cryophila, Strain CCMP2564" /LENGTH=402 /DNA_ID=CAMNT_0021283337 /DNA_START=23 /DNA_END=1232 /DNA_ORIENTATION=+
MVADCEKQSAARLRKVAGLSVQFAQAPLLAAGGVEKCTQDTLTIASRGCFESVPVQMAAFHEEIASNLTLLDNKQGKQLEKLAKKHKAAIEAIVFNVYDRVEKSREDLEGKAVALQRKGDAHSEVWLAQVQQAAARREEREASSLYCQHALSLWEQARIYETELGEKMRDIMSLFIQCQSQAVAQVAVSLETHSRTLKAIDTAADWKVFTSQHRIATANDCAVSHDWREWHSVLSDIARAEEGKGDVMSAGNDDRLLCAGYLQRQGTLLGFNWKKNYFVVTREGFLYYFNSRQETKPDASFFLPAHNVHVQVDPLTAQLTMTLQPKSKSWFGSMSVSGSTKVVVRVDTTGLTVSNGLVLTEWKNALLTFSDSAGTAATHSTSDSVGPRVDPVMEANVPSDGT